MTTRSSRLSSLGRCGTRIILLATPFLIAASACADTISIGVQEAGINGGAISTVLTSSTGNASISGLSYGTFTLNDISAQSRMVLGPPGLLNTQSLDISSNTAGVLTVFITDQGLSFTGAQNFRSAFAVNDLAGSLISVGESTFFSPTNGLYNVGQTLLNSATFSAIGAAGPFITSGSTSGTYSVTEKYVLVDTGGSPGDDNITVDLDGAPITPVVPEPGSLLLVGSGLVSFAALLYRKAKKPAATLSC